jgi:hypothetical protein
LLMGPRMSKFDPHSKMSRWKVGYPYLIECHVRITNSGVVRQPAAF